MGYKENKKVYLCPQKGEPFSKFAIHKKFEYIRTSYMALFSEDELQQMMSAKPVFVYHEIL